jgi:hypothetical protein
VEYAAATSYYEEAEGLASELGMRPLVAHCHLGLGRLYRRTDRGQQGEERLATAMTLYREMGMTYWLEKAEAELDYREARKGCPALHRSRVPAVPPAAARPAVGASYGRMFWLRRNRFVGSYVRLSARSRSYFASP